MGSGLPDVMPDYIVTLFIQFLTADMYTMGLEPDHGATKTLDPLSQQTPTLAKTRKPNTF